MKILIIGAGDVGFRLAKRFARERHDITIVEQDEAKAQRARTQLDAAVVQGDGGSYKTLSEAGIDRAEIVTAVTDSDEINLMACRLAKKCASPMTIARVRSSQFTDPGFPLSPADLGVDHIIHPEKEAAEATVQLLNQSYATYVMNFEAGKIQVLGVRLDHSSPLVGVALKDLMHKLQHPEMRVVAIYRNHRTLIPQGDDKLQTGDQVFVVCDSEACAEFIRLAGKIVTTVSDVMLLGGGLIGQGVAERLASNMSVKLIEEREERAWRLANSLPLALVIHGDGTDLELLATEGVATMGAFAALTGDDGKNIITSLLARRRGVPRVITLINKVEYLELMPTIGLDTVVSKQLLTVNAVQRFVHHRQVASFVSLPNIHAHFIEYIAQPGSVLVRKPLRNVKFPRGAIVGAVLHDQRVIIPTGHTQIRPNDRVVVFALPESVLSLDKLFDH